MFSIVKDAPLLIKPLLIKYYKSIIMYFITNGKKSDSYSSTIEYVGLKR